MKSRVLRSDTLGAEGARFVVVGVCAVLIDLAVYLGLVAVGLGPSISKGAGFIVGAIWAYAGNRLFTFQRSGGQAAPLLFAGVYLASLGLNIAVNAMGLILFSKLPFATLMAFVCATGASAVCNFIGLKYAVFRA